MIIKTVVRPLLVMVAVFLTAVAIAAVTRHEQAAKQVSALAPAPSWQMKGVAGTPLTSLEFKGKVVILDFWATWCGPCRMEIPGLIKLYRQYRSRGLVVIGASVDDGPGVVKSFMKEAGIDYPVAMADEKTQRAFGGIEAIPTTFIIDRAGRLVSRHLGYTDQAEFAREIRPLLKR